MKDTYYVNKRAAVVAIVVLSSFFVVLVTMLVIALINSRSFVGFFSFCILLVFIVYNGCVNRAIFDKIKITSNGITVLAGIKRLVVFIPWHKVNSMQIVNRGFEEGLIIRSNVDYKGKPFVLIMKRRKEVEQLLSNHHIK